MKTTIQKAIEKLEGLKSTDMSWHGEFGHITHRFRASHVEGYNQALSQAITELKKLEE